jgi:hypothetical protein
LLIDGGGVSTNETDGRLRKHRHDLGHEDHGAKLAAGTTKAIQALLGLWIALTMALVVYALVDASRTRPATPAAHKPARS